MSDTLPNASADPDLLRTEIPEAMQRARRWLLWRYEPPAKPGAKPRKVPYYADGGRRVGKLDTDADRARLVTLGEAIAAAESRPGFGLGFGLGPDGDGNHWQGIDLDSTDSRPELAALVDTLPGYVERSPSGTGVHAVGIGAKFATLGSNTTGIEAYSGGRYFTVTADAIGGDLEDVSAYVTGTLVPLHGQAAGTAADGEPSPVTITSAQVTELRSALFSMRADDRDLWVRMGHGLRELGDVGRELWLTWSATSDKFDAADAARVWDSLKPERTGYAAVFAEAQRHGWANPGASRDGRDSPRKVKVQSYTSCTSNTDAGSGDTENYTDPFQNYTSCTDALPPAPGALVRDTEKGPRLEIASAAALVVADTFAGRFAYCTRADVWHRYTGAHWEPMPTAAPELHEALTRWLFVATGSVGFTPRYADSILTLVQRAALRPLPEPSAAIPFANGLLDMHTGALMPVSPQTASTWSLPYEYRTDADCPRVKAWLLEAVGNDADVRELLRAWLAALLRGGAHLQRLLHLIGPGGTGKSTFLRLVEALVGTRNCVTTDLKELETNRFETAALYGKRAALITDSDKYGGSVNVLKAITGQDPVRLERKHVQQSGSFIFDGLVIVASNEPLATTDYTSGLERRRCTVLFERRVTDAEKAAWAAQGGEQAILHAELPGVVNWALTMPVADMEAMIRNPPAHTARANLEAMRHGNPCADWLVESCVPEPDGWCQVGRSTQLRDKEDGRVYFEYADSMLYPNYLQWCNGVNRAPLSLRRFRSVVVDAAQTLGYRVIESRRAAGQGLSGLRLRHPKEPPHPWKGAADAGCSVGSVGSVGSGVVKNGSPGRANAGSGRSVGFRDHIIPRAENDALKASADFQAPAGGAEEF